MRQELLFISSHKHCNTFLKKKGSGDIITADDESGMINHHLRLIRKIRLPTL